MYWDSFAIFNSPINRDLRCATTGEAHPGQVVQEKAVTDSSHPYNTIIQSRKVFRKAIAGLKYTA